MPCCQAASADHTCLIIWPEQRLEAPFSPNLCARRPFYLTENDAAPDAMSFRRVPCYLVNLAAFSKVSRDGKDELQFSAHYAAETFIKNCSDCLLKPIFGKLWLMVNFGESEN